jgi:hypothetical protein
MKTVGEASDLAGITVRTLHHYDELGLLSPSGRTESGYRLYSERDLARMRAPTEPLTQEGDTCSCALASISPPRREAMLRALSMVRAAGMISVFTPAAWRLQMARRTISLPQSVEDLARESAREGESFSATVARLIEQGARVEGHARRPSYAAAGEGDSDLGREAERYLRDLIAAR